MLNGRDDFMLPYETNQQPLFEALGTKRQGVHPVRWRPRHL